MDLYKSSNELYLMEVSGPFCRNRMSSYQIIVGPCQSRVSQSLVLALFKSGFFALRMSFRGLSQVVVGSVVLRFAANLRR